MDLVNLLTTLVTVGIVIVAAVVTVVYGIRRGVDQIETRSDKAMEKLNRDLTSRVELLERERAEDRETIAVLKARVAALEAERAAEREAFAKALLKAGGMP
jgi:N-acyl-L-homoserine lactone synthetase